MGISYICTLQMQQQVILVICDNFFLTEPFTSNEGCFSEQGVNKVAGAQIKLAKQ